MKKFNLKTVLIIVIPIILFILLTIYVQGGSINGFENWVYNEAIEHMNPTLTTILKVITEAGSPIIITLLTLLLVAFPKTRKKYGYPMSFAIIVSEGINLILKEIFARERPDILQLVTEHSYSFPSGHAMINTTMYIMFALLAKDNIKNKKAKMSMIILCILLPLIISFSRIYLGVHYAGDVLGGILLGFSVAIFAYTLLKKEENLLEVNE
ncbi:MAG: phosphatase PAP2 family protein [Clostridia bacterium]|nr:phosphatase PAP2 family protein [Clostridia bacterium]